jgi:hypothetical protein
MFSPCRLDFTVQSGYNSPTVAMKGVTTPEPPAETAARRGDRRDKGAMHSPKLGGTTAFRPKRHGGFFYFKEGNAYVDPSPARHEGYSAAG